MFIIHTITCWTVVLYCIREMKEYNYSWAGKRGRERCTTLYLPRKSMEQGSRAIWPRTTVTLTIGTSNVGSRSIPLLLQTAQTTVQKHRHVIMPYGYIKYTNKLGCCRVADSIAYKHSTVDEMTHRPILGRCSIVYKAFNWTRTCIFSRITFSARLLNRLIYWYKLGQ